jgi:hypothetical protein
MAMSFLCMVSPRKDLREEGEALETKRN